MTITHAEVAACARALLIGAEAAYRGNDETEVMLSLLKLAQLLAAFPLPPGSAEAELLAGSIQQQTSMEFRRVGAWVLRLWVDGCSLCLAWRRAGQVCAILKWHCRWEGDEQALRVTEMNRQLVVGAAQQ